MEKAAEKAGIIGRSSLAAAIQRDLLDYRESPIDLQAVWGTFRALIEAEPSISFTDAATNVAGKLGCELSEFLFRLPHAEDVFRQAAKRTEAKRS
jgi:hypothetical protein